MPRTGTNSFSLLSGGNYATDNDLFFLSGRSTSPIFVDYATGIVSGSIDLAGSNFYKSQTAFGGLGFIPFRASIVGNTAVADVSNAAGTQPGSMSGKVRILFLGPNADEVIIIYAVSSGTQAAVGAVMGIHDPYY